MLCRTTVQVLWAVAHLADGTLPALCSQCISAVRASWTEQNENISCQTEKWFSLRFEYVDHAKRLGVKRLKLFPYLSWKENRRGKKKQRCQKLGGMQTQKHKLKAVSTCSCYTKYTQSLPQVNIFLACLFISKFYELWPSLEKFNIFPLNTF